MQRILFCSLRRFYDNNGYRIFLRVLEISKNFQKMKAHDEYRRKEEEE